MRHVLSVTVENQPGVLASIVNLFSGRGFNIESLNVGPSFDKTISVMTITTSGDDQIMEQIVKQLHKLIPVIKVVDLSEHKSVMREMLFLKISAVEEHRAEIFRIIESFRCTVVDISPDEVSIEVIAHFEKSESLLMLLSRYGIKEMARSGMLAIKRSAFFL